MRALAELLGAYGVRHFSRKLVQRLIAEVDELKVSYLNRFLFLVVVLFLSVLTTLS